MSPLTGSRLSCAVRPFMQPHKSCPWHTQCAPPVVPPVADRAMSPVPTTRANRPASPTAPARLRTAIVPPGQKGRFPLWVDRITRYAFLNAPLTFPHGESSAGRCQMFTQELDGPCPGVEGRVRRVFAKFTSKHRVGAARVTVQVARRGVELDHLESVAQLGTQRGEPFGRRHPVLAEPQAEEAQPVGPRALLDGLELRR